MLHWLLNQLCQPSVHVGHYSLLNAPPGNESRHRRRPLATTSGPCRKHTHYTSRPGRSPRQSHMPRHRWRPRWCDLVIDSRDGLHPAAPRRRPRRAPRRESWSGNAGRITTRRVRRRQEPTGYVVWRVHLRVAGCQGTPRLWRWTRCSGSVSTGARGPGRRRAGGFCSPATAATSSRSASPMMHAQPLRRLLRTERLHRRAAAQRAAGIQQATP